MLPHRAVSEVDGGMLKTVGKLREAALVACHGASDEARRQ